MPDTNAITPAHMSTTEIIIYAATAIGGVVGGVVSQVLRFGARVKALEEGQDKSAATTAEIGKLRDEMSAHVREVNTTLAAAKADPAAIRAVVTEQMFGMQRQLDKLAAEHGATSAELTRVRNAADRAEEEGARKWATLGETLGEFRARLRTL